MPKLTAQKAKSITAPGLHGDGQTLYLAVAPGGSKSWIQRLAINGRRHDIGLGGYPLTSLAEARDKAFANRKLAREGGDPLKAKRKAQVPTFTEAADRFLKAKGPAFASAKGWRDSLVTHAFPILGDMPVDRIGREDVLRVLTPLWTDKAPTAKKLRQRIKATLAWAQAHGFLEHNLAGDAIDGALPTARGATVHHRALPHREVADALATVDGSGSSLTAKLAFRFVVLTAARGGEVRGATWEEIDLEAREWRIPASRMKAGTLHRVPLSDEAMAVLEEARPLSGGTGLIFPSPTGRGGLSNMTLTKILRDNGLADRATVHGMRSAFRDWCADSGVSREIAEAALAHTVQGVEGAYLRSDLLERRRTVMAAWADYLDTGASAKVVPLRA